MNLFGHLVGLLRQGISMTQGLYLHRTTQHRKTQTYTSMPWVGFDPMIPVFKRPKIVYALDHTAIETITMTKLTI